MRKHRIAICCFTMAAQTTVAAAQIPASPALSHQAPVARATQTSPGTITIDGRLDEAVWARAEPVTSLTEAGERHRGEGDVLDAFVGVRS